MSHDPRRPPVARLLTSVDLPRRYDASKDYVAHVKLVTTASVNGPEVVTGRVSDDWHVVAEIVGVDGREVAVLLSKRGWLPLGDAESEGEPPERRPRDRNGLRLPTRTRRYTTASPPAPRGVSLSAFDRKRIAAALLSQFLGPLDL